VVDNSFIDISNYFPDYPETVKMSERPVAETWSVSPNVQAGTVGVSIGEWNRQHNRNLRGLLHLHGDKKATRPPVDSLYSVDLHW
jgi:hypothetical protein